NTTGDGGGRRRPPPRFLDPRMTAVNADAVAGYVRRSEEREPHDVVPVHVRHEDVVGLRRRRAVAGKRFLAEGTHAGAQIAENIFRTTGFDLDAGAVAAIRP